MKGFNLIKSDQALAARNIFTVLFGLPGVGKTTVSFTFPNPILHFDFDRGISRAFQALRPDTTEVTDYGQFHRFVMSNDFERLIKDNGYKSVVIDTVGTMLDDFVAPWLIQDNPKNGMGGGLSLQGWGQLSVNFSTFKARLQNLGLEMVAICHGKEEGEDRQYRLAVKGGSTDVLYRSADLIGFVYVQGEHRYIDFSPSQSHIGKNTARLPKLEIPNAETHTQNYANFGTWIIDKCKERMLEASNSQIEAKKAVAQYLEAIEEAKKAADFDAIIASLKDEGNKTVKVQVKKALGDALKAAKYVYNTTAGKVEKATGAKQEAPTEAENEEA